MCSSTCVLGEVRPGSASLKNTLPVCVGFPATVMNREPFITEEQLGLFKKETWFKKTSEIQSHV